VSAPQPPDEEWEAEDREAGARLAAVEAERAADAELEAAVLSGLQQAKLRGGLEPGTSSLPPLEAPGPASEAGAQQGGQARTASEVAEPAGGDGGQQGTVMEISAEQIEESRRALQQRAAAQAAADAE
jgi:hypothetical protein